MSVSREVLEIFDETIVFPAVHYISSENDKQETLKMIREELQNRLVELKNQGKLVEAQRLDQRTRYDMEMIKEMGYCSGIEN